MTRINSKADLNRAIAEALCPEPPLSERRAIHESGVWRWVPDKVCWCDECRALSRPVKRIQDVVFPDTLHDRSAHWEPADFCIDPAASYLLEQKLIQHGWWLRMEQVGDPHGYWVCTVFTNDREYHHGGNMDRLKALALAAGRALNLPLALAEGWDA